VSARPAAPVIVSHGLGSYQVEVAPGALRTLSRRLESLFPRRRVAVITDETVARLLPKWLSPLPETILSFPAGEQHKTRETWARLSDQLLDQGFGRDTALVAVGGGVVGDVAGFVAATYLRGVPVVQAPTTLLAMLDASVGGKVGVDTAHGKNLIGAFHPPALVLADPLVLADLPDREYRAGLAEAVKHGIIADRAYLDWIRTNAEALLRRDTKALVHLVRRSVEIKAAVVSEDEREGGKRAILNAGHTVAHAIEHASNYRLLHGEAVAIGLLAECALAEELGIAPRGSRTEAAAVLSELGLPTTLPIPLPNAALLTAMALDKKNRSQAIRFALPSGIGSMHRANGEWTVAVHAEAIGAALETIKTKEKRT
jgi:3-dehydroquinate synthase